MQFVPYATHVNKNIIAGPSLKIYYFGPLRIEFNGTPLTLRTTKTAALLAYLALEGQQPQPRIHLANLLWDGYAPHTARSSLRVALTYLRQALLPLHPIQICHKRVQWGGIPAEIWCDVLAFEEAIVSQTEQSSLDHLQEALALYKNEFLAGWENVDSTPFQKWLLKRRLHYQTLFNNVRQHFSTCFTITAKEAAVPPTRHNILRPLTPLIGRAETVHILQKMLLDHRYPLLVLVGEGGIGKTRLAQATAWALMNTNVNQLSYPMSTRHTAFPFTDGVWFVPLNEFIPQTRTTSSEAADRVAAAISATLALHFTGTEPETQQLSAWLHEKALLLILDGFEHLTGADAFLSTLLQTAPRVKVLVTSRRRLNLQAATIFPVQELGTPDAVTAATATVEQLQSYPSVQLFVERAQRIRMNFQLDAQNSTAVAQICHLAGGIPLGIELASAMMTVYSPPQIAAQLAQDAVNLPMPWADLSPWHRSMEQVLVASWQLLTPEEANVLAQCAVISGHFSWVTALTISKAAPVTFRALVEKSLLRQDDQETDCFTMHSLLRQYARRHLKQTPLLETQTCTRHAIYYLTLLQEQHADLPNERAAQQLIQAELENIRAAWTWSSETGNLVLLENAHEALAWFYRVVAIHKEAFALFSQAVAALPRALVITDREAERHARLQAKLLILASEFGRMIGHVNDSKRFLQEAKAVSQQIKDTTLLALTYNELALVAQDYSDYANLAKFAKQSVELAEQTENLQVKLACQLTLAVAYAYNNQHTQVYIVCSIIDRILEIVPNHYMQAMMAVNLGSAYMEQHEYTLAFHHLQQALSHQYTRMMPITTYIYTKLGQLWCEVGVFEQAEKMFTQAFTYLAMDDHPICRISAQYGLGLLQQATGNITAAHQQLTTALTLAREQQNARLEHQILVAQGDILMTMGALSEAMACYQDALRLSEHLGDIARMGDALASLAKLRLAQQDFTAARVAVDTTLAILAEQGLTGTWFPFRVYWYCYQVLRALQDSRATPLLQQAYNKLMQIAERIQKQTLKRAFLRNVPVNRALVDAMNL